MLNVKNKKSPLKTNFQILVKIFKIIFNANRLFNLTTSKTIVTLLLQFKFQT